MKYIFVQNGPCTTLRMPDHSFLRCSKWSWYYRLQEGSKRMFKMVFVPNNINNGTMFKKRKKRSIIQWVFKKCCCNHIQAPRWNETCKWLKWSYYSNYYSDDDDNHFICWWWINATAVIRTSVISLNVCFSFSIFIVRHEALILLYCASLVRECFWGK